jgi:hypothetical protein
MQAARKATDNSGLHGPGVRALAVGIGLADLLLKVHDRRLSCLESATNADGKGFCILIWE